MGQSRTHGGARKGAGRPRGSRNRRTTELADRLIAAGDCPVDALVRLARDAETAGDRDQAISAWRAIAPYVYPKPKSIEIAPEDVVALARDLAEAKTEAPEADEGFGEAVERMKRVLEEMGH